MVIGITPKIATTVEELAKNAFGEVRIFHGLYVLDEFSG
jgi:hypothetical protein